MSISLHNNCNLLYIWHKVEPTNAVKESACFNMEMVYNGQSVYCILNIFGKKLRKKRCKSSFITCHNKLQMTRVLSSSFSSPTQIKFHFICKIFNNTLNINKKCFLLLFIHSLFLSTYRYYCLTNNQLLVISNT